ncbi:MAG TPA: C25 family cysteine peptidase [bacterium]|nr:C25 family cysteine peptidase [bacterium]
MRRMIFLSLCFVILAAGGAWGETLTVDYHFSEPTLRLDDNEFVTVSLPGCATLYRPDQPQLPVKLARILLPAGQTTASLTVTVLESASVALPAPLANGRYGWRSTGPDEVENSSTGQARIIAESSLAGARLLLVRLSPVVYREREKTIETATTIRLTVTTKATEKKATAVPYRGTPFDRQRIGTYTDNPAVLATYGPATKANEDWQYLVVTTSALSEAFTDYLVYKQQRFGLTTHLATMEDILATTDGQDDADRLRNFLREAYAAHGTRWVLLGGDADGETQSGHLVPLRCMVARAEGTVYDECIPGDLFFGNLDGPWDNNGNGLYGESNDGEDGGEIDLLAELFVGRIPADTVEEARRQLNKILAYDQALAPASAILVGELLWPAPPVWGGDLKDLAFAPMSGMDALRLYARDDTFSGDALRTAINGNEHQIINASEHGNWYNVLGLNSIALGPVVNDLPLLTNTLPFFGYSQGCFSGAFDNCTVIGTYQERDCIAEELLTEIDAGAFAMIVNSREGFANWSETGGASSEYDIAFMEKLFGGAVHMGQALAEARESKIGELDGNANANRWCFFQLNLLGDPHQPLQVLCDADGDGYEAERCGGADCDDFVEAVHPDAAEDCADNRDNNCDGLIDADDPQCAADDDTTDDEDDSVDDDNDDSDDDVNDDDDDNNDDGCGC